MLLRASNISKRFGPTQALDNVSVEFARGEVHALMGENGAGKSTLGKVIAGLHKQDSGEITIYDERGQPIGGSGTVGSGSGAGSGGALQPGSMDAAFAAGIRLVHQELAQCPNLNVAENLCLHALPRTKFGLVDDAAMIARARRLLADLEPQINVRAPLGTLSPGHRQIVQIAAALDSPSLREGAGGRVDDTPSTSTHSSPRPHAPTPSASHPRVIVFDEPTSSLSIAEVERLLAIIRDLAKNKNITCIYVSHRMSEIFAVCDRVTVLRDGKYVATSIVKDIDEPTLVEQMIGRKVPPPVRRHRPDSGPNPAPNRNPDRPPPSPALSVRNLTSPGKVDSISFDVAPGEILGIGGLVGAGRSELLDALFGLDPHARGTIIAGVPRWSPAGSSFSPTASSPQDSPTSASPRASNSHAATVPSNSKSQISSLKSEISPLELSTPTSGHLGPRAAIAAGIGYVPEDRKLQGLFFQLGVGENIVSPFMARLAHLLGLRSVANESALISSRLKDFEVKTAGPAALPGSLSGGNQQKLLLARWLGKDTQVLLLDEPTRGIDVGTKAQIYKLVREAADRGLAVVLVSSEMPELLALSDRIIVLSDGKMTGELHDESMTQASILRLATLGH